MSHWLTDELHVSLSPTQVAIVQVRRSLSVRGIKREVVLRESVECHSDPLGIIWAGALQALDNLLSLYVVDQPNVILVLSNNFVRYALVPWSDLISSDDQQLTYARHCFHVTYGAISANWQIRLSRSTVGAPQIASAIDDKLFLECNEVVKRNGLRLVSLQPYLMSAFNRFKLQLQNLNAWFALVEPGCICLTQLEQGKWVRLRTARLVNGWEEISRFLLRETLMGNGEIRDEEQVLYLYAPHLGHTQTIKGWQIIGLPDPLPFIFTEEKNSSLVMALSGTING